MAVAGLMVCAAGWSGAQTLAGDWTQRAQQRIEEHRKTDLRVIVLDEHEQPAAGARVQVQQLEHDFPLGVVLEGETIAGYAPDRPVLRCFNAVSLERLTAWSAVQPDGPEDFEVEKISSALAWAKVLGLRVHWGGLVSADAAYQPGWAVPMSAEDRLRAAARYVASIGGTFGRRVDSVDVYTRSLDHAWLTTPAQRWLFNRARAAFPGAALRLRYEQSLDGDRARQMLLAADDAKLRFIDHDGASVDHRFTGTFYRGPVDRVIQRLGTFKINTLVTGLEVGGESALDAPVNLEAMLIMLFAEPSVPGIYLDALTPVSARDPLAALLDEDGEPTGNGLVVDRLFRQTWWTDSTHEADELGNVRMRVFAGRYRVTATLADGRVLTTELRVPKSATERIVVLEPVWAGTVAE